MKNFFCLVTCLSLLSIIPFTADSVSAQTDASYKRIEIVATEKTTSPSLNLSEVSSATQAPSNPGILNAYATGFVLMADCTGGTPCTAQSNNISKQGTLTSPSSATTLTYTFSSPPPGPFMFSLDSAAWFTVDGQTAVISNIAPWTSLFPVTLSTVYLKTDGFWSPPESGKPYPWLQYYPNSVTLVYQ